MCESRTRFEKATCLGIAQSLVMKGIPKKNGTTQGVERRFTQTYWKGIIR